MVAPRAFSWDLGALNFSILVGYQAGYFQGLIPPEQAPLAVEALNQITSLPWIEMLLGALERVFVLCIQLALSLLVMQVFTRRRIKWLFLAIGWHAIIDAVAVLLIGSEGIYAAEIATGVAAIISLAVVLALREPEPGGVALEPLPAAAPTGPLHIKATQEKLEDSRYI